MNGWRAALKFVREHVGFFGVCSMRLPEAEDRHSFGALGVGPLAQARRGFPRQLLGGRLLRSRPGAVQWRLLLDSFPLAPLPKRGTIHPEPSTPHPKLFIFSRSHFGSRRRRIQPLRPLFLCRRNSPRRYVFDAFRYHGGGRRELPGHRPRRPVVGVDLRQWSATELHAQFVAAHAMLMVRVRIQAASPPSFRI